MTEFKRLYKDNADFFASCDKGIKLVTGSLIDNPPAEEDFEDLKSLLSIFITGTINMDPKAFTKIDNPDVDKTLITIRMALLAAYNLGRKHEN